MRSVRILCAVLIYICLLSLSRPSLWAQTLVQAKIVGEDTQRPIAGASITEPISGRGTSSDASGAFRLFTDRDSGKLEIRAMGFRTKIISFPLAAEQSIITLQDSSNTIQEVAIRHRGKYSNKNNKAVELIDLVIAHKDQNRLSGKDSLAYQQYDKLKVGIVDPPMQKKGVKAFSLDSIFANVDTSSIPGMKLLTIYQEESSAEVFGKRNPKRFKKRVYASKKTELNRRYINNPNIQASMNYIFQEVDVYDENIFLLNRQFLSPIAHNGKIFYRYYITDTLHQEQGDIIRLEFEPRNKRDLLFTGTLEVAMDGTYAVKSANLFIDKSANLNWVKQGTLAFHYSKRQGEAMLLDSAHTRLIFGLGSGEAIFAERYSANQNYQLNAEFPEGAFKGAPVEVSRDASTRVPDRPSPLSQVEENTYDNVDQLNKNRGFNTLLAVGYLAAQGYYSLGIFELGPLEYLYSRNNVEGNRFRLGGRTTGALTDKGYLEGYLAYGTDDDRLKYFLRAAYSLNGQSIVTFPAHYIEASVQNDIMEPGQAIGFLKGDSFFRSIRKNRPTKWFDTRAYQLQHVFEFGNHLSLSTGFTHRQMHTTGDLRLEKSDNSGDLLEDIQTNEVHVDFRWAPFEKFYYKNLTRRTIIEKHPVINIIYTHSLDGFWNSSYRYDKLTAAVSKRFFLGQLGFADATVAAGKIWGTLPYTLLELPNVKQKEDRHRIDFDLMEPMEFVGDQYLKFGFFHQMQGFLLNKIPFIKRLNLREIWGGQMFYGKVSDRNNPYLSDKVVQFDKDAEGVTQTHVLVNRPYWEGSVGLDNILNLFRVEYVKRFNYRDLPNVSADRYRVSLHVNF